jgi:membrane-associated phospholipid phosphatase
MFPPWFGVSSAISTTEHQRVTVTDPALWAFTLGLAVVCGAWMALGGWTVRWVGIGTFALLIAVLVGIGAFYQLSGRSDGLARIAYAAALLNAFAFVGLASTYVAGMYGLPFVDDRLRTWDAALGFDWWAYTAWLHRSPRLTAFLNAVYWSHLPETALAVIWVAHRGSAQRLLRAFAIAFVLAVLGTVLLPAVGTVPTAHAAVVRYGLRAGTYRTFDPSDIAGLISMPSFHAVLAVLVPLALWPTNARWLVLVFNLVLLVATVSEGGHYLVDVLAGIVVALFAWIIARRWGRSGVMRPPT